jgi:hypothetical protein
MSNADIGPRIGAKSSPPESAINTVLNKLKMPQITTKIFSIKEQLFQNLLIAACVPGSSFVSCKTCQPSLFFRFLPVCLNAAGSVVAGSVRAVAGEKQAWIFGGQACRDYGCYDRLQIITMSDQSLRADRIKPGFGYFFLVSKKPLLCC